MIRIQNIYYMLAYAFQVLKDQGYASCGTEAFDNTADLLSAILTRGITVQIKRGLGRDYQERTESLSCLRGKIDVSASIKNLTIIKQQLVCNYDEFTVDTYYNQILKTTVNLLLRSEIPNQRKKIFRNLMLYFKDVGTLDPANINWNYRFNRNTQSYQMLISICYLVINGLLQTDRQGNTKLQKFLDEQRMCRLYEKFILEYYRKEFPMITVSAVQIPWQLDDGVGTMLPIMKSDITLTDGKKTLIIDAKYYQHMTQKHFDVRTLHSNNLYQIFAYVKNKDVGNTGNVSGMLLYAKTDEMVLPDSVFQMSGNKISVRSLDLDCDFAHITGQLNSIVKEQFMIVSEAQ